MNGMKSGLQLTGVATLIAPKLETRGWVCYIETVGGDG